jgi:hypothetical protein
LTSSTFGRADVDWLLQAGAHKQEARTQAKAQEKPEYFDCGIVIRAILSGLTN